MIKIIIHTYKKKTTKKQFEQVSPKAKSFKKANKANNQINYIDYTPYPAKKGKRRFEGLSSSLCLYGYYDCYAQPKTAIAIETENYISYIQNSKLTTLTTTAAITAAITRITNKPHLPTAAFDAIVIILFYYFL